MEYFYQFLPIAAVHLLAVMSPGPDFVMVTRNVLVYSRKTGVYSAIGLGLGILLHVTYSLVGIGILIAKSVVIFSILKTVGAIYLFYIGYLSLTSKPSHNTTSFNIKHAHLSPLKAINIGFLTNITNPKVTLFFLAIFTQVINPKTPVFVQALYGLEMSLMTVAWFSLLSFLLSHKVIKAQFSRLQVYAERVMGVILIALGIKLILSHTK